MESWLTCVLPVVVRLHFVKSFLSFLAVLFALSFVLALAFAKLAFALASAHAGLAFAFVVRFLGTFDRGLPIADKSIGTGCVCLRANSAFSVYLKISSILSCQQC